jgi:hypothetical protein
MRNSAAPIGLIPVGGKPVSQALGVARTRKLYFYPPIVPVRKGPLGL